MSCIQLTIAVFSIIISLITLLINYYKSVTLPYLWYWLSTLFTGSSGNIYHVGTNQCNGATNIRSRQKECPQRRIPKVISRISTFNGPIIAMKLTLKLPFNGILIVPQQVLCFQLVAMMMCWEWSTDDDN